MMRFEFYERNDDGVEKVATVDVNPDNGVIAWSGVQATSTMEMLNKDRWFLLQSNENPQGKFDATNMDHWKKMPMFFMNWSRFTCREVSE